MDVFVRSLITEWRKLQLPFAGAKILLAVSGGADSCALLLGIEELLRRKKLTNEFLVVHFNHCLRGAFSDSDEAFVRSLSERNGLRFVSGNWEAALVKKPTRNVEQRARDARYEFFLRVAEDEQADYVLTAHTKNDQAETLLMNLVRGAGIDGLAGMRPVRKLETGNAPRREILLVRPFVNWATREQMENYCEKRGQAFLNDSMNDDEQFARVKIRKRVIPLLAEFNPRIVESLSRCAEALRDVVDEFNVAEAAVVQETIKISALKNLTSAERTRYLRAWIKRHRGNLRGISLSHITAVEKLCTSRKSGRVSELPGGQKVEKVNGTLVFGKGQVEKRCSDN